MSKRQQRWSFQLIFTSKQKNSRSFPALSLYLNPQIPQIPSSHPFVSRNPPSQSFFSQMKCTSTVVKPSDPLHTIFPQLWWCPWHLNRTGFISNPKERAKQHMFSMFRQISLFSYLYCTCIPFIISSVILTILSQQIQPPILKPTTPWAGWIRVVLHLVFLVLILAVKLYPFISLSREHLNICRPIISFIIDTLRLIANNKLFSKVLICYITQ